MKRLLSTLLAIFAVTTVFADNYIVIISTLKHTKWEDKKGNIVAIEIESDDPFVFKVNARTPEEAENKALNECEARYQPSIEKRVQTNVTKNDKLCDRYEKIILHRPQVKLQ